jgi:hypothetical protein
LVFIFYVSFALFVLMPGDGSAYPPCHFSLEDSFTTIYRTWVTKVFRAIVAEAHR